jgi:outer membrane protein assembly factor BamA
MKTIALLAIVCAGVYVSALAQSDSEANGKPEWDLVPLISTSPETSLMLGVNPVFTFRLNRSDTSSPRSFLSTQAFGTLKRQFGVQVRGNFFWGQNKYVAEVGADAARSVWRYYGIGNGIDLKRYDTYRFGALYADAIFLRKLAAALYAGVGYRYNQLSDVSGTDGGLLAENKPVGYTGFTATGPALVLRWDSRDHRLTAYRGYFLNLRWQQHWTGLGSTQSFETVTADLRRYIPLSKQSASVLALQLLHYASFGQVPFAELGQVGGSVINRGYFQGGYRDRHLLAFQAEVRQMFGKTLGGVLFASAGNVMAAYDELGFTRTRLAAGAGLRFVVLPQSRVSIRLDFAWGQNSSGLYFGINEAF